MSTGLLGRLRDAHSRGWEVARGREVGARRTGVGLNRRGHVSSRAEHLPGMDLQRFHER